MEEVDVALMRRSKGAPSDFFPGFADIVEIGIGSLATVYRAREVGTNRLVALKLLNVRDASPRAIESFERESIALGAVSSHPNIVTLYRSFRAGDGRPVLVLELCSGSIGDRMQDGHGLPVPEVVSLGIKIAGALETAHRAQILHRDVKPQNILITEFGEPALADFGVAMLQSSTQTTAGLFDFTTLHAAPELLEGGETSAATDVYELASSLYQLIAGRSAFRAYDGESPASVILRILRDPVQPVVTAHVPSQLSDLLVYAMSKDKASRPPTAAEFAAELATVEADQQWPRTQFLIRDPATPGGTAGLPTITRMPMLHPRSAPPEPVPSVPLPSVVAPSAAEAVPGAGWTEPDPAESPAWRPGPHVVPDPGATHIHPTWRPAPAPAATPAPVAPPAEPADAPVPAAAADPVPARADRDQPDQDQPQQDQPDRDEPYRTDTALPRWMISDAEPEESGPSALGAAAGARVPVDVSDAIVVPTSSPPIADPAATSERSAFVPPAAPSGVASAPPATDPDATTITVRPGRHAERSPLRIDEDTDLGQSHPAPMSAPPPPPSVPPPPSAPPLPSLPPPPLPPAMAAPPTGPAPAAPLTSPPAPDDPARTTVHPVWTGPGPAAAAPGFAPEPAPVFPAPPAAPPARQPGAAQYPIPPAGYGAEPSEEQVPTWAFRAPVAAPPLAQPADDLTLDPMSLRRRVTIRSGLSSLVVDDERLQLRALWRRTEFAWSDILGFEPRFDGGAPATGGRLVALTRTGPVELAATKRPLADLRYVHALLDAYRWRAQIMANR